MEAGIPAYREFLFAHLATHPVISDLKVLHSGEIHDCAERYYENVKLRLIGSYRLGVHLGVWHYLQEADVVVSSYNLRILTCWLPSFAFRRKWIFWGKGLGSSESQLVALLRKITARTAQKVLVYNEEKRGELLESTRVPADKVIAYQNTVYVDRPYNYGNEYKNYFLYFGRLQERKGLRELIEQYAEYVMSTRRPKYNLRIVGDGLLLNSLVEAVGSLGVSDYVEFFPGVYDEERIAGHFKHAAIYVSPFNVGLGVVHSLSYGVPVLTCNRPQVGPEFYYLNSSNSIVVPSVSDIASIFRDVNDNGHQLSDSSYGYYSEYLHHSIMLKRFTEAIIEPGSGK